MDLMGFLTIILFSGTTWSQFLSMFNLRKMKYYFYTIVEYTVKGNLTLILFVLLSRFTPEDYIKCLLEYNPTTLFVVPSLLAFLATHPLVKKEYLQSVETIMVGAAPITDSMLEKFLLKCEKTKDEIKLLQGLLLHFKT